MIKDIHDFIRSSANYQIETMRFNPCTDSLEIHFIEGSDLPYCILYLYGISLYKFSKNPEDNEGCFLIGKFSFLECHEGGKEILKQLNYGIHVSHKNNDPYTSKEKTYHLHIDGDVVCDVICQRFNFLIAAK
jgi:hypothetical protein